MSQIFMTGGTGFIGRRLAVRLIQEGFELTILSRKAHGSYENSASERKINYIEGVSTRPGPWQKSLGGHEIVINLTGSSIFGRWTENYKREIKNSRLKTTHHLVEALTLGQDMSKTLLNASAVGYYGFRGEEELTEESSAGNDFLARVCQEWEGEAKRAEQKGWRVVLMRFGLVLGKGGGVLSQLVPLYRKFLGGRIGRGQQWFSWVHLEDLVEAIIFFIKRPDVNGPVNLCSPHPVRQKELARFLGKVLKRPAFLSFPAPLLRLLLGEFATVLLQGQRAYPARLIREGFVFRYPFIEKALVKIFRDRN